MEDEVDEDYDNEEYGEEVDELAPAEGDSDYECDEDGEA